MAFIFGGNTPWTYEDLQRKRAVAESLLAGAGAAPRNVGEGLNAIGKALAYRGIEKRASKEEARLRDEFNTKWGSVMGGVGSMPSGPGYSPAGPPLPPPDPNSPHALGDATMAALGKPKVATGADPASIKAGLVARGLPEHIADGFVMNFADESGFDPGINEANPVVPGSRGGFGLYQLTGPRRVAYEAFAAERGVSPDDVDAQLDFLMSELQGPESAAWDVISSTKTPGEAGAAIVREFLRPAEAHRDSRVAEYLGGQGMDIASLATLAGDPMASPQQKAIVEALIGQQMAMMDPMRRIEMEKAQLELAQMKNPGTAAPEALTERQALLAAAGIDPASPEGKNFLLTGELPQAPEPPKPYSDIGQIQADLANGVITPEQAQTAVDKLGGGTSVTVNNGGQDLPGLSKLGEGMTYLYNPDGTIKLDERGVPMATAVVGGPADTSSADAAKASGTAVASDVITTAADRALAANEKRWLGGLPGAIAAYNPSTENAEVYRQVEVLTANAKVENLQAMRNESKTGGALGSVTEKETQMLADQAGALNPASPNFKRDVLDYTRNLLRVIHGDEAGTAIFNEKYGDQIGGNASAANGVTTISNDAEYDALPSGTVFIGPDGITRRKP